MVNEYVVNTHKIENGKLKPLVKEFPNIHVQCREKSTIKKYHSYFNSWQEWSLSVSIQALPAKQFHVALYILYLIQQDSSFPVIESSCYSIKFYHLLLNLESPCKLPVVKNMLEAAKRVKHHKTRKKKAITVGQINKMYDHCIKIEPNIYNMKTFTLVNLSFCGFLRYREASNIRRSDINFQRSYMKTFIEKSKTDIYRNGNWIYVARGNSELCPVATLQRYLNMAKINENSEEFIFRSIASHRNHQQKEKCSTVIYKSDRTFP